CLQYYSIPFTF
nr:immunoglobulin light chain junction region [Macaca mulatta]MOV85025.1 immunoglobulin light chain junction region [Macaca mulatta]